MRYVVVFALGVAVGWSTYEKIHNPNNYWSTREQ